MCYFMCIRAAGHDAKQIDLGKRCCIGKAWPCHAKSDSRTSSTALAGMLAMMVHVYTHIELSVGQPVAPVFDTPST